MRDIKFRAWSKNVKQMFEVVKINFISFAVWFKEAAYIGNLGEHDITLLQYTGLKDSKNREIYEGDIVRHPYHGVSEVFYRNGGYRINGSYSVVSCGTILKRAEIIGNIYENPELLTTNTKPEEER